MDSNDREKIEARMKELKKEIRSELERTYQFVDSTAETFDRQEDSSAVSIIMQAMLLDRHMVEYRTLARLLKEAKA